MDIIETHTADGSGAECGSGACCCWGFCCRVASVVVDGKARPSRYDNTLPVNALCELGGL